MAYVYKDLAEEVLKAATAPMSHKEIWAEAQEKDLVKKLTYYNRVNPPKTPWMSISSQIYLDMRDNPESTRYIKVGENPVKFFLAARQNELTEAVLKSIKDSEAKQTKSPYHERDLHPLVAYFAYSHPLFNRGRSVYTKTIYHEKSNKKTYAEWLHPDIVGFYLPINEWENDLFEFNKISDNNALRLFSFEIKKDINKSNYREYFFQAVSNSSWAHEGYLVATSIDDDENLLNELERLSMSFGIGIISIDLEDIENSSIKYPAKVKDALDWETMNKLSKQNTDFQKFLRDSKNAFTVKSIYKSEYDEVLEDPQGYINTKLLKIK